MTARNWKLRQSLRLRAGGDKEAEMGKLIRAAKFIQREILEILPVTIFFLIGFNLIAFSKHLVLSQEGIVYEGVTVATLGALVVAKVVLIADKTPMLRLFRGRPLYRPILYRTIFYTLCVLLVHALEKLVHHMIGQGENSGTPSATEAGFVWEHFVFVQLWVFVLFLVYVTLVELRDELGHGEMAKILFSRGEAPNGERHGTRI